MQRFIQTLDLVDSPELMALYRKMHTPEHFWPEIREGIRQVGISRMDIYQEDTRLVMVLELPDDIDRDEAMAKLATLPRQQEWEEFIGRCQKCAPDSTSGDKWRPMEQIFNL